MKESDAQHQARDETESNLRPRMRHLDAKGQETAAIGGDRQTGTVKQ